jgi:hypothetical protein
MNRAALNHVLARIATTPLDSHPFPHIVIPAFLPDDFFREVMGAIPPREDFDKVEYPGTGFGRRTKEHHDYGLAYRQLHQDQSGMLCDLRDVISSPEFSRALLEKFSQPGDNDAIPHAKRHYFANGADDYSTVFDLQVDLPGYQIAPHADISSKIVTFQLYLTRDATLARYGTLLCEPKDDRVARGRRPSARFLARVIGLIPARSFLYRRIYYSRWGLELGVGGLANWLPWSWFNVAKTAEALPNHFLAFAPNERSFHAVDLDIPPDSPVQEREVIRGFIRAGRDTENWMTPYR